MSYLFWFEFDQVFRSQQTIFYVQHNTCYGLQSSLIDCNLFSYSTQFTFNFMDLKPTRGFYKASVSAGSFTNTVTIKVLTDVSVDYLEIGTADADQTTQPKLFK